MMNAENDDQPSPVLLANSNSLVTNTNILLNPSIYIILSFISIY